MIVSICGIPHKVIECEDYFDIDSHLGQIEYKECLIKINSGLAPELKRATICHEILHGLLVHVGRNDLAEEEVLVTALGNAINGAFDIKELQINADARTVSQD